MTNKDLFQGAMFGVDDALQAAIRLIDEDLIDGAELKHLRCLLERAQHNGRKATYFVMVDESD